MDKNEFDLRGKAKDYQSVNKTRTYHYIDKLESMLDGAVCVNPELDEFASKIKSSIQDILSAVERDYEKSIAEVPQDKKGTFFSYETLNGSVYVFINKNSLELIGGIDPKKINIFHGLDTK